MGVNHSLHSLILTFYLFFCILFKTYQQNQTTIQAAMMTISDDKYEHIESAQNISSQQKEIQMFFCYSFTIPYLRAYQRQPQISYGVASYENMFENGQIYLIKIFQIQSDKLLLSLYARRTIQNPIFTIRYIVLDWKFKSYTQCHNNINVHNFTIKPNTKQIGIYQSLVIIKTPINPSVKYKQYKIHAFLVGANYELTQQISTNQSLMLGVSPIPVSVTNCQINYTCINFGVQVQVTRSVSVDLKAFYYNVYFLNIIEENDKNECYIFYTSVLSLSSSFSYLIAIPHNFINHSLFGLTSYSYQFEKNNKFHIAIQTTTTSQNNEINIRNLINLYSLIQFSFISINNHHCHSTTISQHQYCAIIPNSGTQKNLSVKIDCQSYKKHPFKVQGHHSECGNTIKQEVEQCDDGNINNDDGCSSQCKLEINFTCQTVQINEHGKSKCYYLGQINISVIYIEKLQLSNQLIILIKLSPIQIFRPYIEIDNSFLTLVQNPAIEQLKISKFDGTLLQLKIKYCQNIDKQYIALNLNTSKIDILSRIAPFNYSFPVVTDNNAYAGYFSQEAYNQAKTILFLTYLIVFLSLLLLIIGIFYPFTIIIPIDFINVVQFCLILTLYIQDINPSFKMLTNFRFMNGISVYSFSKEYLLDNGTPSKVKALFLYTSFYKNFNISILPIVLPYLMAVSVYIFSKTVHKNNSKKKEELEKLIKQILCTYVFGGLLFTSYIVHLSVAIQIKYGFGSNRLNQIGSIIACVLPVSLYIVYFLIFIKFPDKFGVFHRQMKYSGEGQTKVDLNMTIQSGDAQLVIERRYKFQPYWYILVMAQKIITGNCLIYMIGNKYSLIPNYLIFLGMMMVIFVRAPYKRLRHNIRYAVNLFFCLIVQSVYQFYGADAIIQSSIWFSIPLIICIVLVFCLTYNIILATYDIYQERRQCRYIHNQAEVQKNSQIASWKENNKWNANNLVKAPKRMQQNLSTQQIVNFDIPHHFPDSTV